MNNQDNIQVSQRHFCYTFNINNLSDFLAVLIELFDFIDEFIDLSCGESEVFQYLLSDSTQWLDVKIFIKTIRDLDKSIDVLTIASEECYIDREYRDSYYLHYSEEHLEYSRYCKRILFFKGDMGDQLQSESTENSILKELQDNFIGSMVLRPIAGISIGRTLLCPCFFESLCNTYIRLAEYKIHWHGKTFSIKAFPFRMQDKITTSCAETTLINIFDYYSKKYVDYKFVLPSDLYRMIKYTHHDRVLPTTGISYTIISRILYESGFAPKLYMITEDDYKKRISQDLNQDLPIEILSYYIESGMPVAVGLHADNNSTGHSVVCIGHTRIRELTLNDSEPMNDFSLIDTAKLHDAYVFQDDSDRPYVIYDKIGYDLKTENGKMPVKVVLAPLHRRMFLEASTARDMIKNILNNILNEVLISNGFSHENPVVFRLFLSSSRHFKEERLKEAKGFIRAIYEEIPLPNFIWVCELYSKETYPKKTIGDIILDSTSPGLKNSLSTCLLILIEGYLYAKDTQALSLFYKESQNDYQNKDTMTFLSQLKNEDEADINYCTSFSAYNRNLDSIKLNNN